MVHALQYLKTSQGNYCENDFQNSLLLETLTVCQ